MFQCIYLNKKRTDKKLYRYVKDNLIRINNNPDIAYYLLETTGIEDIIVDPSKIEGSSVFMSLWTVLQNESYNDGHQDGIKEGIGEERMRNIKSLSKVFDAKRIAELLSISLEEVENALKSGK